jgi:hypothetical protein
VAGRGNLGQRQRDHAATSPKLAGGDVDAAWDDATGDGEELVGGDTPTPGQDRVDDIGEGAGLTYKDDEPLNFDKVLIRDQHRWELNAASAADEDEVEADEEVEDLDELGLIDGETESLEVLDVDDLAEDEEEADEIEEADVEDLDELEDDDKIAPDDDEEDDDEEEEDDDDDDEDDDDDDF